MALQFWILVVVLPLVCWGASMVPASEGRWKLIEAVAVSALVIVEWMLQRCIFQHRQLERSFSLVLFLYASVRAAYGAFHLLPCGVLAVGSLAGFPGAVHSAWPMALYGYWGRASPRAIAVLMGCASLYLAPEL